MAKRTRSGVIFACIVTLCAGVAFGQGGANRPPLPFEVDGPSNERIGTNSFGGVEVSIPDLHSEEAATPQFNPDNIIIPPDLPPIPRIYITVRYYTCNPWFIHPYRGTILSPTDLIASVRTTNPEWAARAQGRPLEELMQVDPELGEPLVTIEDEGLVDENNEGARAEWAEEQLAEAENAEAVGVTPQQVPGLGVVRPILHAPFYGLYCLRVRICIPFPRPGVPYRYWIRWRFQRPGYCWRRWWWHCWYRTPSGAYFIRPWRPWCTPYWRWTRRGPDWVWTVTSTTRWRYWCLYGLRYHFTQFVSPTAIPASPKIANLNSRLVPGALTTGWIRPYPYPRVRYWPFRPYLTRWYWFRCLPWITYRHIPPILQAAIATPKAEFGDGFLPAPDADESDPFPSVPPVVVEGQGFDQPEARVDSFFDVFFDIAGVCTTRPLEVPLNDLDGNGATTASDNPVNLRLERIYRSNPDREDDDGDDEAGVPVD